jgi:hypothetical protein
MSSQHGLRRWKRRASLPRKLGMHSLAGPIWPREPSYAGLDTDALLKVSILTYSPPLEMILRQVLGLSSLLDPPIPKRQWICYLFVAPHPSFHLCTSSSPAAMSFAKPHAAAQTVARIQNFEPSCDRRTVGSRTPPVPTVDLSDGLPPFNSVQFNPSPE